MKTAVSNPYLDEVKKFVRIPQRKRSYSEEMEAGNYQIPSLARYTARDAMTKKYAWAIPSKEALRELAKFPKIVEVGAGNGYWAHLLKQLGVEVDAIDDFSWSDQCETLWTEVLKGDHFDLENYDSSWTLFLCWPPYATSMAARCLEAFRGTTLAYVGESEGGCNGDGEFWDLLSRRWTEEKTVFLPQWDGVHDNLTIYQRVKSIRR